MDGGSWGAIQPRGIPLPVETELISTKRLPWGQPFASTLPIELHQTNGSPRAFIIDLGRMAMAYPRSELDADEGSVLQFAVCAQVLNGQPARNTARHHLHRARRVGNVSSRPTSGAPAISSSLALGPCPILRFKMTDRRYPFERVGHFHCSDAMLNRLWEMAVNTIEVTSDDAYGSDARERNEWLQDPAEPNFITTRVALAGPGHPGQTVFSDPRLLKNLMRHAALAQLPDGRIRATFPTDRGPEDCHFVIDDYSCQWVESLRLYIDATDDKEFLREMWPTLTRQMQWFLGHRTPRGTSCAREYVSCDNPLAYVTCEGATINAYFYQALRDAAYLGRVLGDKSQATTYTQAAEELYKAYNRRFWNKAEDAYNSAFLGDKTLGPTACATACTESWTGARQSCGCRGANGSWQITRIPVPFTVAIIRITNR